MINIQCFIKPLKMLLRKTPDVNLDFCLWILVYEICAVPPLFWLRIGRVLAGGEWHTVGISRLSLSKRANETSTSHKWSHNESVPCVHLLVSPGHFHICGHLCNQHFFPCFVIVCLHISVTQKSKDELVDCLKN